MTAAAVLAADDVLGPRLAELARAAMAPQAYDYCAGAAGDQATVARNVAALDALLFTWRVLGGAAAPRTRVRVPGGELAAPLVVAPMGLQGLCCPDAEVAGAAAAAELGLGHCLSMFASRPVEEVAGAGPGVRWQQLYLLRDRELTRAHLDRAEAAGCAAIVVTVDVPVVGRRTLDRRNSFDRFAAAPPALLAYPEFAGADRGLAGVFPDARQTWADIAWLAGRSALPVLVKGVLDPRDARLAVRAGAAGVVVSNHGGRQLDRCVPAIGALGAVVAAVPPDLPVFFDSGIRRGSHIAAALALGARAVLVGRPVLWGLAVAGREGARVVLTALADDLRHVMTLVGAESVEALREIELREGRL
jgi:4-hydroxymandelate oxidase